MRGFAERVVAWQRSHGRHDLPWQNTRDPYAVWVSEIMLQQTQVAAVIPYYLRFMAHFPTIASLAQADEGEVLRHWSGLGYYSRARNLHAAALHIVDNHGGQFPSDFAAICALPGVGRSTAAAIAAFCFGQRRAILDGNVKRVFTRHFGIAGWPGQPAVEKRLWQLAESQLPDDELETYTQGLMDLGATLCTRTRPQCPDCPLRSSCTAHAENRVSELPTPKPRKPLPQKQALFLLLRKGNEILLEKRPPTGIWGGLWSLPEAEPGTDARQAARSRYGLETELQAALPNLAHAFSHFRLSIKPQPMRVTRELPEVRQLDTMWLDLQDALGAALPTPVRKILLSLADTD